MQKHLRYLICAIALLVFVASSASAAEGRYPIWTPTVIAPGSPTGTYYVSRDIVVPAGGGPAITVIGGPGLAHVDIDLNGFTLFGDPGGSTAVIAAAGPLRSLTIRNGNLHNLGPIGDGIRAIEIEKVIVSDVKITDGDDGIHLEDVIAFDLRRNVIVNAGATGISATGFGSPVPITGSIEDNIVRDATGGDGIRVEANHSSVAIKNNRVDSTGDRGIVAIGGEGFIIAENTVESSGAEGIFVEASNNSKIFNNSVTKAGDNGITLIALGGFLVLDNVSSFNGRSGLFVDGFLNHIDRNVLNANGAFGMHLGPGSADNTYGRNTARGNGAAAPVCAFILPVEPCAGIGGGGGSFPPDFCNESAGAIVGNTSYCDNLMPGPPRS